jgi:hypothetical protein
VNALRQFTNTAALVGGLLLFSFSSGVAQTAPNIGLRFSSGHLVLNLNGDVGAFYSIQYANGLSGTNQWIDRSLLQAQANGNTWTDPFVVTNGQLFWRAVSVPSPTDANLAFIPPGTFVMGSPTNETSRAPNETQHRVTLSRGFWIGKFELTQAEYLKVMGGNPSWFNGIRNGTDYGTDLTRPVESMRRAQFPAVMRIGCPQNRSGNMRVAPKRHQRSTWETHYCRERLTLTGNMNIPFRPGKPLIRTESTWRQPHQLAAMPQTHGDCTTRLGMFGSGVRTGSGRIRLER